MYRDALAVARKDLRIEWVTRITTLQVVPFAVVVVVLFGFALGPDPRRLQPAAPGVFWLGVLFASVLGVQRAVSIEFRDGSADGLRLSGLDPAGVFYGKLAALGAELCGLEVVLAIVTALVFQVSLAGFWLLVLAALLATLGVVSVGLCYGVLLAGSRVRETLLPLLFFPVIAPVLLAGTKTWQAALGHHPGTAGTWIELLGAFAVIYLAVGTVSFGTLLEDA